MRNFISYLLLIPLVASAQVGIGTTTPAATLDVVAANPAAPTATTGFLVPRVSALSSTDPGALQHGMIVLLTATSGIYAPGFYYWDSNYFSWMRLNRELWSDNGTFLYPTEFAYRDVVIGSAAPEIGKLSVVSNRDTGLFIRTTPPSGLMQGIRNEIINSGSGYVYGLYNQLQVSGGADMYGVYNEMAVNSVGKKVGMQNFIAGPNIFGTANNLSTNGNATGVYSEIQSLGPGIVKGVETIITPNQDEQVYGTHTTVVQGGNPSIYGHFTRLASYSFMPQYGHWNEFDGFWGGAKFGYVNMFGSNQSTVTGFKNEVPSATTIYGLHNYFGIADFQYGVYNDMINSSYELHGMYNNLSGATGSLYGVRTNIGVSSASLVAGSHVDITGFSPAANVYGHYSRIVGAAGNQYGYFSEVLNPTGFAAFFIGRTRLVGETEIGNVGTSYKLPLADGSTGQAMVTDGAGNVSWGSNNVKPYTTTGAFTGDFLIDSTHHTVRVFGSVNSVRLPDATANFGRIYIIIGSNGITPKPLTTLGGIIYDDVTNTFINTINPNERLQVQSDGWDWIVIGR